MEAFMDRHVGESFLESAFKNDIKLDLDSVAGVRIGMLGGVGRGWGRGVQ